MKRWLLIGALLCIAGCYNTKDKYLERRDCVSSHDSVMVTVVMVNCGKNCMRAQPIVVPTTICDEYKVTTYRNPHYKGNKQ